MSSTEICIVIAICALLASIYMVYNDTRRLENELIQVSAGLEQLQLTNSSRRRAHEQKHEQTQTQEHEHEQEHEQVEQGEGGRDFAETPSSEASVAPINGPHVDELD